jgi:cytochrome c oxidase assembly factor CtaG
VAPRALGQGPRRVASLSALVLVVAAVVPPLATLGRRYDFVEACQFDLLAVAVPALLAVGAPWNGSDLARRLAAGRRRHPERLRSLAFLVIACGTSIAWRTPPLVDAVTRHSWLLAAEAATLVPAGIGLWLELVESPPLSPRSPRPLRAALAAVAMWALWVTAYAVGFSKGQVYVVFSHPESWLSAASDQELATAIVWFAALCAFVPVAFFNLVRFLQASEEPDEELRRLVREEARRGMRARSSADRPPAAGPAGRP